MTHPTLCSTSTMENKPELGAEKSCLPVLPDTCQNLHNWNVNDTDEEPKTASNLRVQKC